MGDVVYLAPFEGASSQPEQAYETCRALDEALGLIARGLDDIEAGRGIDAALQSVTANLLHLLRLVERSPSIEEALDSLHDKARRLAQEVRTSGASNSKQLRDLRNAYVTFRSKIWFARPLRSST